MRHDDSYGRQKVRSLHQRRLEPSQVGGESSRSFLQGLKPIFCVAFGVGAEAPTS
jgi:hypothetical protein